MTDSYRITGISEALGATVASSRFSRQILEAHRPFFGGRALLPAAHRPPHH